MAWLKHSRPVQLLVVVGFAREGIGLTPYENNASLFFSFWALALMIYAFAGRLGNSRLRRGVRVSAVYLSIPLLYFGHPFLYYQVWMVLAVNVGEANMQVSLLLLGMWFVALAYADRKLVVQTRG